MSKELEYIREIQNELNKNYLGKWKSYWNIRCNEIKKALERLEAIESADSGNKALKELEEYIKNSSYTVGKRNHIALPQHIIYNALFVFKKQQQELDDLKEKIVKYLKNEPMQSYEEHLELYKELVRIEK